MCSAMLTVIVARYNPKERDWPHSPPIHLDEAVISGSGWPCDSRNDKGIRHRKDMLTEKLSFDEHAITLRQRSICNVPAFDMLTEKLSFDEHAITLR